MATRLGDLVRHLPARLRIEGTAKQSIETARHRLVIAGALFALAFVIVALRLVDVTILKEVHEPRSVRLPKTELQIERADIVDRNGVLLATSLATGSLYANPKLVLDPADAAAKLARGAARHPREGSGREARLGPQLRLAAPQPDAARAVRGQPPRHPRPVLPARGAPRLSARAARPRMSSASPTSTSAASPASSSISTTA